jgi:hypothetical protein
MPDASMQPKIYRIDLAVESETLRAAIETEIATRAGGAAQAQTGGHHHQHLADLIREALTDHLGVGE